MSQEVHASRINAIAKDATKVRNFCVLAHVDHGKTTLSDVLVASNGLISQALAGQVRFRDCREYEQRRMITMKASTIALRHTYQKEDYVLNLIDSLGHVDFSCEVSTAVRLSDGAFLLVDAVDGVATQTRAVLEQAYRENVKCCLVVNKVDLLITTQGLSPEEAYLALSQIISSVNVLMAEFVEADCTPGAHLHAGRAAGGEDALKDDSEEQWFEPAKGNVIFASSVDGWGFTTAHFARLYAQKLSWSEHALRTALWGEWYLDQRRKKIVSSPPKAGSVPMCVRFVLEQIWKVYGCASIKAAEERTAALVKMCSALGMNVKEAVLKKKDGPSAVAAVMNAWLPLATSMMDACVQQLPSPAEAQPYRMRRLLPDLPLVTPPEAREAYAGGVRACSPDGQVLAYIARMFDTECLPGAALQEGGVEVASEGTPATSFVGVARLFAGTIRRGDTLLVLDPKHKPGGTETAQEVKVRQLFLLMGRDLAPVAVVHPGSIFGVGGLGTAVLKSATLASTAEACGFSQMVFQSAAVIRMSVEPANPLDLEKLKAGLALLNKADPQVEVLLTQEGELVICTAGEVHAERCILDLNERYAQVAMRVSEPLVGLRETICAEQRKPTVVMTSDKQCSFAIKAYDIPTAVTDALERHRDTLRALSGCPPEAVPRIARQEDVMDAARDVHGAVVESGGVWPDLWRRGFWSLGPRHCGTNILACSEKVAGTPTVWGALAGLLEGETAGGEAAAEAGESAAAAAAAAREKQRRVARQINDSIVAGFQMAAGNGPLCDEPMTGVAFVLEELTVTEDAAGCNGPLSGQAMSAVFQGCRKAFMAEGQRLVEPMYECDVTASTNCHGKVYEVLKKRRAEIIDNIPQEGTMAFRVLAYLPVAESFGLADEMRVKTSGNATPTLRWSHWSTIHMDPYFVRQTEDGIEDLNETDVASRSNVPRNLINRVRKRKGLPVEEIVVKAEKMKLAKQLEGDHKKWEEKLAAAMREHEETCARLRREAAGRLDRQEMLAEARERELQEEQDKVNAEGQAKAAAAAAAVVAEASAKRLSEATRRLEAAILRHARKMAGSGVEEVVESFFKATSPEVLSSLLNVGTAGQRAAVVSLTATDKATGKVLCASGVQDFAPAAPPFSRLVEWGRLHPLVGGTIVLSAAVPLLARCDEGHLRSLPASVKLRTALNDDGLAGDTRAKTKLLCTAERDMAACLAGSVAQPRKLIALSEGEQLTIPPEVASSLQLLPGPFHIVAMIGVMRIGKSFLLSALVRLLTGCNELTFGVSNQTTTYTKGVDYCAAPHPDGGTVLFLDVEGADSTDRSRVYDNVLFSTVFLMSSAVLFNCDRIPNDAGKVNSLECSVEIARTTAECESVGAKRVHLVCRNSNDANRDGDTGFRNSLLESAKKDGSASKGFFNCFSRVALHLLGCPMNSPGALVTGLEHRRFEEYCPLFAAGLSRLASVVARDLQGSAPLAVRGSVIPDGAALSAMLQGLLSSSVEGKAKFASLSSAAEMLQRTGMDAAVKKILREAEEETWQKTARLLPVGDAGFEDIAAELKKAATATFDKRPFVVVDEEKVTLAKDDLSGRLAALVRELRKDNEARSHAAVQQRLLKADAAAPESFHHNPSAPDDDPEARFASHVDAVVRTVVVAADCVASAGRDRAIDEFKKGAESRLKMVRESAAYSRKQDAALKALEQSRLGMEEERASMMERQAQLRQDKSMDEEKRKKLAKELKADNKMWEEKAAAMKHDHEETAARLAIEAAERERFAKARHEELRERMNKAGADEQAKLMKEIQQAAEDLRAEKQRSAKFESDLDRAWKKIKELTPSCFTGDARAALAWVMFVLDRAFGARETPARPRKHCDR